MARETFRLALEDLQKELLQMGSLIEDAIARAVRSLKERDQAMARAVIAEDDRVDRMHLAIEQECLRLLALQQPMARDLRAIGTALKIVTDLERIGDHAVDIAKVTIRLGDEPFVKPLVDIPRMAEIAQRMVRESLTAYIDYDAERALRMVAWDDEIDHLYAQIFRELLLFMMEDPRTVRQATQLLFVGQHLERIGDHATNLGEWIIYMVTGERKELND